MNRSLAHWMTGGIFLTVCSNRQLIHGSCLHLINLLIQFNNCISLKMAIANNAFIRQVAELYMSV